MVDLLAKRFRTIREFALLKLDIGRLSLIPKSI